MADHSRVHRVISMFCFLLLAALTPAQTTEKKLQKGAEKEISAVSEPDSPQAQRRTFAISLVTSLAEEARSYRQQALRPRVLALAADTLWGADSDAARLLFRRAWEAAEAGDAEDLTKTDDSAPLMVTSLKRMSGRDLRSGVLVIVARRDRALAEEFLKKLREETKHNSADSKNKSSLRNASENASLAEISSKRLQLASRLLDDDQIERALEFATPALDQVNANSIGFLSALRVKRPEVADQRFAFLLNRAEFDPSSDANTVSGLSSYAFTPSLYLIFSSDGGVTWRQVESVGSSPPNLAAPLRAKFFQVASSILLRPLPPLDQDFTSSGRMGRQMVVKRLLPLFDQYAPNNASALRVQLAALPADQLQQAMGDESSLLTRGLKPEETGNNSLEQMQDRLDRSKTSQERDSIYADVAATLASQGDARAQDTTEKIEDSDRRAQVRQYVDLELVKFAVRKKEPEDVGRLAKSVHLSHTQRAWAYTQAAGLLMTSQPAVSLEFLEQAEDEARLINADDPDRARALIAVATKYFTADRVRAWEIMGEAVKSANSAEKFTGESTYLYFPLATGGGVKISTIGGEDFGLSDMLRLLTRDDLYRSNDLAKRLKNDLPRATAILAIASVLLEKQAASIPLQTR